MVIYLICYNFPISFIYLFLNFIIDSSTTRHAHRRDNTPYPRFWTGVLGGGVLGYLFGRRNSNNYRTQRRREPSLSYSTSSSNYYNSYTTTTNDSNKYTAYGFAETDRR
jgi:hypothetical protein